MVTGLTVKTTFGDSASYGKISFLYCRNKLLMVGLSSETTNYSRTDGKSQNPNAIVTVEIYLFYC